MDSKTQDVLTEADLSDIEHVCGNWMLCSPREQIFRLILSHRQLDATVRQQAAEIEKWRASYLKQNDTFNAVIDRLTSQGREHVEEVDSLRARLATMGEELEKAKAENVFALWWYCHICEEPGPVRLAGVDVVCAQCRLILATLHSAPRATSIAAAPQQETSTNA